MTAWAAIKLNMEKAYDIIEWDFLLKCLQELGFHPTWNSWIKRCISLVSYSIIVDDEPNGLFMPIRGNRQEDALSPYVFILCMEALNNMLLKEAGAPRSGIRVKICPSSVKFHAYFLLTIVYCFAKLI